MYSVGQADHGGRGGGGGGNRFQGWEAGLRVILKSRVLIFTYVNAECKLNLGIKTI